MVRGRRRSVQDARIRLARSIRAGAGIDAEEVRLAEEAKQTGLSAEI